MVGYLMLNKQFCSKIAWAMKPLMAGLKKNAKLVHSAENLAAFEEVKRIVSNAPCLDLFCPTVQTIVETDASDVGISAVLKK